MTVAAVRRFAAGVLAAALLALAGCAAVPAGPAPAAVRLDSQPRVAVVSAFEPELALLLARLQDAREHHVNGVRFTTGTLEGKAVVLFLSGVSMTNATMTTQLALDRFDVTHIVFSGIAGGVNPSLHIGDVAVPARWGQYLEVLMARETAPGQYTPPGRMTNFVAPPFGMMFPRSVEVRSAAQPQPERRFWFEVDPALLAQARALGERGAAGLARCTGAGGCLTHAPRLVVGGNGVSGQAFVDNRAYREYAYRSFQANVLDMETAAVGMVAFSNGVPYIAFRSLSDLAGGGEGENELGTFFQLAADNSARVLLAFLAAWH